VTEKRRDTVEGLNRRISCIHRMYSSRCGRRAARGSRLRSASGSGDTDWQFPAKIDLEAVLQP